MAGLTLVLGEAEVRVQAARESAGKLRTKLHAGGTYASDTSLLAECIVQSHGLHGTWTVWQSHACDTGSQRQAASQGHLRSSIGNSSSAHLQGPGSTRPSSFHQSCGRPTGNHRPTGSSRAWQTGRSRASVLGHLATRECSRHSDHSSDSSLQRSAGHLRRRQAMCPSSDLTPRPPQRAAGRAQQALAGTSQGPAGPLLLHGAAVVRPLRRTEHNARMHAQAGVRGSMSRAICSI